MHKTLFLLIILFISLNIAAQQQPVTAKLAPNDSKEITLPQFPGGEDSFYTYLSEKIKYPPVLIKIRLEGNLDIKFTIDEEGKTKDVEITRGFDPDADDEVLRVIRTLPAWTPAKENGKVVDYTHHLTVNFTITEELIEQAENPVVQTETINEPAEQLLEIEEPTIDTEIKVDSLNRDPQYPGGQEAMEVYFKKNMKYPKRAIEYGIEGRVIFNLEISPEGKISNIWIFKGLFYECDDEAFYLIKKMPDWIPGLKDGKPVTMRVIVPVPFVLPK